MSIELRGLGKRFGSQVAVRDVDLAIRDGEFFVLLGPSGCGKTTTLRMIAGLEASSDGSILMQGRDVTRLPPRERDIAMVFQDYGLYPHLSVFENIAFPLRLRKVGAAELQRRVGEVAERLHLVRLLGRKPGQISGGEKQRVALGRALVRQPRVFLMDEPLSNLDARLRIIMRTEIKRLVSDLGITTVYVTHDQVEAMALASRIGVMNQGVLEQVAEPLEVYDRPASIFVASFIGSPPMNLMEVPAGGGRAGLPPLLAEVDGLTESLGAAAASGNLVIGVRPEHVELAPSPANGSAQARVELVEALGQDTYLYLRSGDTSLVAVTKRTRIRPGDIVGLRVEPQHIHVMDRATGRRRQGGSTWPEKT